MHKFEHAKCARIISNYCKITIGSMKRRKVCYNKLVYSRTSYIRVFVLSHFFGHRQYQSFVEMKYESLFMPTLIYVVRNQVFPK